VHHLIVIYYLKCGLLAARIDWGYAGDRNCVKVSILKSVFEPFVTARGNPFSMGQSNRRINCLRRFGWNLPSPPKS